MKKLFFVGVFLMLASVMIFAAGERENEESGSSVPEIHFYKDMMNTEGSEAGSDLDILTEIQNLILENTGVKIITHSLPSGDEYATKLNLVLSSGTQVDAFLCDGGGVQISNYSSKGLLLPLQDLLADNAPVVFDSWTPEIFAKYTDPKGNIWGIPSEDIQSTFPTFIREDWLNEYGLEYPKTITELENVLKVFKEKDPVGNGKTVPMVTNSRYSRWALMGAFVESGYGPWYDESTGQIKHFTEAPGVVEYLTTLNRWYKLGYLHKDFASMNDYGSQATEVAKGNAGVVSSWYSVTTFRLPLIQENNPEANYIVGPITGPAGVAETDYAVSGGAGTVVTSKCKNPEDFMKVLAWAYDSLENFVISDSGIKGVDWQWAPGTTDVVQKISDRKYYYDYRFAVGSPQLEYKLRTLDPMSAFHMDFQASGGTLDQNRAKVPFDASIGWDVNELKTNIPEMSDIDRLIEQESIKFIIGARSLAEYDDFIDELYKAGMKSWIDEYTRQYKAMQM